MFILIFGACFCTLLIIGWKFLLTSSKPIEQSQNSIESTEDNQQTVRTNNYNYSKKLILNLQF